MPSELLKETAVWRRLEWHVAELGDFHLREAFESDPTRGTRLAAEAAGVYLDYSKNLVTDDTLSLLRRLALERGLEERIRGVARTAGPADDELERALAFASDIRTGAWVGATGEQVRAVVVVGTDLGPQLAYEALRDRATPDLTLRFVSGVDPVDLARATVDLDLRTTLFVVSATQATGVTLFLTLTLAPLGGAWWSLEIVPAWMRTVGHISPVAWAMDGFRSLMFESGGVATVAVPILVLLGMTAQMIENRSDLPGTYRAAAAAGFASERLAVREDLTRRGIEVVDALPADLAPAVADRYLALKAAGRL